MVKIRRSSGTRAFEATRPEAWSLLEQLVDPVTRGDPESPLRRTCKSSHVLAAELFTRHGIRISDKTVAKMLKDHGYSLQAPNKAVEGTQHPDRNAQFEHINATAERCLDDGVPVISVDTKKKELVGNFKNGGREWQPEGEPELVDVHDFPHQAIGKAVFLDESGLNVSMTRSHAWVKKGCEYIERTPMNWGKNLTLLGAMRLTGWVVLNTMFATTNKDRFVEWLADKLLPKLHHGDVLVLDNLSAHHDVRVQPLCAAHGVRVTYLPPYSHDFNPNELGWGFQKQHVRRYAPRNPTALRRVAWAARFRITSRHSRGWFAHCGYRHGRGRSRHK
jgi:transposase